MSTLNAQTANVTANAAIVPAGQGGDIAVFAADDTDLIVDINGYFAPPSTSGLSLHTLVPCRLLDTRTQPGLLTVDGALDVIWGNTCSLPSNAEALVLNVTVVPLGSLSFLTLWPATQLQPNVSTLNAYDGNVTSNMAIVPTLSRSISTFTTNSTYLILDVTGYYAP